MTGPALSSWPIPQTPWGWHQHAVVGSMRVPARFGGEIVRRGRDSHSPFLEYLRRDLGAGLHVVVSDPGGGSADYISAVVNAGMLPVVRLQPDNGRPQTGMGVSREQVQRIVAAGGSYIVAGNEPDAENEWDGGGESGTARGWDRINSFVHWWMHNTEEIVAGGGIAMLPGMNAGYDGYDTGTGEVNDPAIDRMSLRNVLIAMHNLGYLDRVRGLASEAKVAYAAHNRQVNHDHDYPNSPTALKDARYFQNVLGVTDPIQRLKNDSTCLLSYELADDLFNEFLGFSIPIISTEFGTTIGTANDSRFPKVVDDDVIGDLAARFGVRHAETYADFSPYLTEYSTLIQSFVWGHGQMNISVLERFLPGHPKRWRPAWIGVAYYHAVGAGGPNSPTEGWFENPEMGRDLAAVRLMAEFYQRSRPSWTAWPARWLHPSPTPEPGPPPVIKPEPQPEPTPPPREEPPMAYWRLAAIHGSNDRADSADDIAAWADINPPYVLLCEPQFDKDHIQRIREAIPGVRIIGRFWGAPEIGVDAWHCPYKDVQAMYNYGRVLARKANDWGLDAVQWANEPGVDDGNGYWFTEAGYQDIARGTHALVNGYRGNGGKALLGTVPLAPGNREDDNLGWGYRGADILRPAFERCDILFLHSYLEDGSNAAADPYPADRWELQVDVYRWGETGKPWGILEFNKDESDGGGRDDQDRADLISQARIFFDKLRAHPLADRCWGVAWFIWNSNSQSGLFRQADYPEARALWREQNLVPLPGSPVPPVVPPIVPAAPPLLYPARAIADAYTQLDAIWGISEKLLATSSSTQAWALRAAVIALKDHLAEGVPQ